MKIGVLVPHSMHLAALTQKWEYDIGSDKVLEAMALADEVGFHSCNLGEHFIIPNEHLDLSGDHYFHTVVALGVVGGRTKNLRLRPTISILPLQNPIVQAKAWSSLDWMTGGRAEPMFGVGWLKEEFDMLGVPFKERGKISDEYLAAMIELWRSDDPQFEGEYVSFRDVGFAPKPVQKPHMPVWLGGDAAPVLRRVARFADGWAPQVGRPETIPDSIATIKSHEAWDGRPLEVYYSLEMLNIGAHHEVLNDPKATGGRDAQKIIDQLGWLAELGVTQSSVPLPPDLAGFEDYLDTLRWIGSEIIPKVASI